MIASRRSLLPTPRLLVVGLVVLDARASRATERQLEHEPCARPTSGRPARGAAARVVGSSGRRSSAELARRSTMTDAQPDLRRHVRSQTTPRREAMSGDHDQTWYEAGVLRRGRPSTSITPSKEPSDDLRGDSTFDSRTASSRRHRLNELLVLGFDVRAHAPMAQRDSTSTIARRRGEPVYVVGRGAGDTISKQIWIERDRLLFVRLRARMRRRRRTPTSASDGYVARRRAMGRAREVEQFVNGKRHAASSKYVGSWSERARCRRAVRSEAEWATAPHWTPKSARRLRSRPSETSAT